MSRNVVRHVMSTILSPNLVQYSQLAVQSFVQIIVLQVTGEHQPGTTIFGTGMSGRNTAAAQP